MITTAALIILGVLALFVMFDLLFRPTIRRLGLRNVVRRRGEAMLVIVGSMLATALIIASFVIGDSFGASIRSVAETRYGPVDEIVQVEDPEATAEKIKQGDTATIFDGIMVSRQADVAVRTETGTVEPSLRLLEFDIGEAKAFGNDTSSTGVVDLPDTLGVSKVALNQKTSDDLGLKEGETFEIFFGPTPVEVEVVSVVPTKGMAGFGQIIADADAITRISPDRDEFSSHQVLLSNTGDVYSGAERTEEAEQLLDSIFDTEASSETVAEVFPVKRNLLENADEEASGMTELFGTIGGFSVAAGILLLVNLFVMLASERKVELGTLRALGLTRSQLRRAFSLEGLTYGIFSAVLGVVCGVGVAAGVMAFAGSSFGADSNVTLRLSVSPNALVSGVAIGLAISQITVLFTALRLVRLNPARALVDAADPKRGLNNKIKFALATLGVIAGVAVYLLLTNEPVPVMLAPVIVAVSAIFPLGFMLGKRLAAPLCCALGIVWVAAVFGIRSDAMDDPDIVLFLVQGLVMVGLGVVVMGSLNKVFRRAIALLSSSYAVKLGLAYPLARPVRSALLISMYALVVFTLTFMSVLTAVFGGSTTQFAAKFGGSSDILVEANPASPVALAELEAVENVDSAVAVDRMLFGYKNEGSIEDESDREVGSILDAKFAELVAPPTLSRSSQFASDEEMWRTVASSDEWIVMPTFDSSVLEVDDVVELIGADEQSVAVKVAGTIENTWMIDSGAHLSVELAEQLKTYEERSSRFYVQATEGAELTVVADQIGSRFATNGVEAESFLAMAESDTAEQEVFFNILQGFLGLGLLIGIAGLGVVLVRSVRDRRQELGMMRTVGIKSSVTRNSFLIEACFIGFQGVALGVGLGLLSSWLTITKSTAFEEGLSFTVPSRQLMLLSAIALGASLLAGLIPAVRAARTTPAEALRVA